jgi:hypothetical protein
MIEGIYFQRGQAESQCLCRFTVGVGWSNSGRALPCTGDRQMKRWKARFVARCNGPNG